MKMYSELDICIRRRLSGSWEFKLRVSEASSSPSVETVECHFSPQALLEESAQDPADLADLLTARISSPAAKIWSHIRRLSLQSGRQLRIRLDLDERVPELHLLPWEGLRDPDGQEVLSSTRGVLFSRFLPSSEMPSRELLHETHVRALLTVAAEGSEGKGPVPYPIREEAELARGYLKGLRVLESGDRSLTIRELKEKIEAGSEVLYFIFSHYPPGSEPSEDTLPKTPERLLLGTRELVAAIASSSKTPKLVVLAGLGGAERGVAALFLTDAARELLRVGVPAVLTLPAGIRPENTSRLMPAFFDELIKDGQVDRALAEARRSVEDRKEGWIPTLFMGVRDGRLWQEYFGRRYRVLEPLGVGGMGRVFRVYDQELKREVALKVLRPDLASNSNMIERFKREIQLSSTVTHANVLRVYDLGEADGTKFLTMQYVAGEDLSHSLQGKPLPISQTTAILRQICEGLGAAHQAGVVHRDLKPSNIMLDSQGRVFIADFGIARSTDSQVVTSGSVLGTPAYMSPEQVKGKPVDRTSDIFSLGVILYQMLSGSLPYAGGNAYQIMNRRLQSPSPVESLNPEVPEHLARITRRCLELEPTDRYAEVAEILEELNPTPAPPSTWEYLKGAGWKPLLAMMVLLVLAVVAIGWISRSYFTPPPADQVVEVAALGILPFNNRTSDAELDWLGDGMARLVADNLAGSRKLRVMSSAGMEALIEKSSGPAQNLVTVAAGGVNYLLTGDILNTSDGLSIAARLLDSEDGREVAVERVEPFKPIDLLKATEAIALSVRRGLALPLEERVDVFGADSNAGNLEAYEDYVVGLRALKDVRYEDATKAFSSALEKSPNFTMARYQLASALVSSGQRQVAIQEIRQALEESSQLSDLEARYIAAAEAWYSRRYEEAIDEYRQLLDRFPYETEARFWLGIVLGETYRPREAIQELEILASLEPELHVVWNSLGYRYMDVGDLDNAERALKRYAELEAEAANPHDSLGDLYRRRGKLDLAAREFETALALEPDFYGSAVRLGVIDVLRERFDEGEKRLLSVYFNSDAPPRRRVTAAFELTHLRHAQGRFRESPSILEGIEESIQQEQRRWNWSLLLRGTSQFESGKLDEAERFLREGSQGNPRLTNGYLFTRGLLELRLQKLDRVRATVAEIRAVEQPVETRRQTAQRIAHYLEGMAALADREFPIAIDLLTEAANEPGDYFALYRLGLAQAHFAAGNLQQALEEATRSTERIYTATAPLELELDRVRAVLLEAEIYSALGRHQEARERAEDFLKLWENADQGHSDLEKARDLASH